ncbi:hypothetical protein D3C72_774770 [compost metagenome]
MPTKKNVPVCSAWGTVMPNVLAIDGALKPMDSTCMASASHTSPKMTNNRYWNLPTPAASMPFSRDTAAAEVWPADRSELSPMG